MQIKDQDALVEMWREDSVIDEYNLTEANLKTGGLTSKYGGILMKHSGISAAIHTKYMQLKNLKRLYYSGRMDLEDVKAQGWEPLHERILKTDVHEYVDSDKELTELLLKKKYHDDIVDFCKYVLKELNNRTFQIKNTIDLKKFLAGG